VNDIHARIIAAKVVEDETVGVRLQPGRVARFVILESIHTHKSSLLLFPERAAKWTFFSRRCRE
jgi:hypothetical protein